MNVRKINLILRGLAATLAAGAVVGLALGLLLPVDVTRREPAESRRAALATSRTSPDGHTSLDAFEPLWAMSLRKSLTDAPATSSAGSGEAGTMAAGQAGPFVLLGTIGDSLAMIRTAGGAVEVKGVGERAGGAKILAVRPSQVDVEVAGERRTLTKPREGSGG